MPNIKILKPNILKYLCQCFIVDLFNRDEDSLNGKMVDLWGPIISKWHEHRFDDPQDYIHKKLSKALYKLNILRNRDTMDVFDNDPEELSEMGDNLFKYHLLENIYNKSIHTHKFPFMTLNHFWKKLYKSNLPKIYVSKKDLRWYLYKLIPYYDLNVDTKDQRKTFMKHNKLYIDSICTPIPLNVYKSHIHHD